MRKNENESFESWIERVREYELNLAKKELKNGSDINLVMEAMTARIIKKILHPLIMKLREKNIE